MNVQAQVPDPAEIRSLNDAFRTSFVGGVVLVTAGVEALPGRFLDFLDPWGNRFEIVGYDNIQFSKAPNVLRGMGLTHLSKNAKAIKELADKGMAPN